MMMTSLLEPIQHVVAETISYLVVVIGKINSRVWSLTG